jgi:hypothetical protein
MYQVQGTKSERRRKDLRIAAYICKLERMLAVLRNIPGFNPDFDENLCFKVPCTKYKVPSLSGGERIYVLLLTFVIWRGCWRY